MLVIIEENGVRDGKDDHYTEDGDEGIIEIDAALKEILGLLVGTEQELFVDVVD